MCGFSTYIGSDLSKESFIDKSKSIGYRGPDSQSFFESEKVMMAFYRLEIIGSGEAGNQPIRDKEGGTVLICNGEIYNYKELISKFSLSPLTTSDCEVISLLYNKIGLEATLDSLDGVYAFVLYDTGKDVVYAARDPYGVRPAFVGYEKSGGILIASEAKAIPDSCERITPFEPGTWWSSENKNTFNHFAKKAYNIDFSLKEEDILKEIRRRLVSSVEKRMMSEREVGCLLSGGLDSSLIAALVCRLSKGFRLIDDEWILKENPISYPIKTFSIGMEGSPDLFFAEKVAKFIGSEHYNVMLGEEEFIGAIPEVVYNIESYDTTTVRASVGNYLVSKFIRDNSDCKVVFNGDGSDEVCCGYVYNINAPSDTDLHAESERLVRELYLFDVLRSDRSISSNGLEPRTPFLDKYFVEYYMSIDPSLKRFNKEDKMEKFLLRKAFEKDDLLPEDVLWRHKCAFSDGVSSAKSSWHTTLKRHVDTLISDEEFDEKKNVIEHCKPLLKESYYYRKLYNESYEHCQNLIPHFWMPKWTDVIDPSARELSSYKE